MSDAEAFFRPGPASQAYETIRDRDSLEGVKQFVEHVWLVYSRHSDPGFLEHVKWCFHQRTWEMYVWYVLHHHGYNPIKESRAGPEFFILVDGRKFWIEAIAPERGVTKDAVSLPSMTMRIEMVPEERILLRFTHALDQKLKDLQKNRE